MSNTNHEQGICPLCGSQSLNYEKITVNDDNQIGYPWDCSDCKATGTEWYDLEFNSHDIKDTGIESINKI